MEYHEAVNTLERLRRLRPKLGTETTASLLSELGDPHEDLVAVQIAGSNGKGSTARVLDRILREAGLDVGLYTSPDLNDLRDRIRVGGQKIPKHRLVRFVEETWPGIVDRSAAGEAPTFFEVFTAMALWHFDCEDVDVAILEVGIGGRYDATSVVDPVASAVTTVSLEHTEILGDSVETIARDKAQVAPAGRPLVTGASGPALAAIREETDVLTVGGEDADVAATETEMVSVSESSVSLVGPGWTIRSATPLLGAHQAINTGIAATLAKQLETTIDASVTDGDVAAGIRNVFCPGRFEVMDADPLVVLDGAHNPDACAKLSVLLDRFEYESLYLVFGAMREKDHPEMCRSLPAVEVAFLAEPAVDRATDTDTLAAVFDRETAARTERLDSVLGALHEANRAAGADDCVLVTGSLYTVAEARDWWTRTPRRVRTETTRQARSAMERADVSRSDRQSSADGMVAETVRFHARRPMAAELKETMLSVGGTAAVSNITTAAEHVEVVLSGTLEQFRELVRRLRGNPKASRHLATQLNEALGIGADGSSSGYPWEEKTAVMGILNVTPDSFHDGGEYEAREAAIERAEEMVAAGADVVDVGGESTRPGADPVTPAEECDRVVPVVEALESIDALVSVDTRKPRVADAALEAGADMINDVTGLGDAEMRRVVAAHGVPVAVMHSLSAPVDPDRQYAYDDVVDDVLESLIESVLLAERAGIDRSDILVDPGVGFGKTAAESFALLDRLGEFRALGTPVMIGHSHKSMFEHAGCGPDERLAPTLAATALAVERGVDLVRVHDVDENVAAVATAECTRSSDEN